MAVIELFSCEDLYDTDVEQIELIFPEYFYYFEVLFEDTFFIYFDVLGCIPLRFYADDHIGYQFPMVMQYLLMFSSIDTQTTKSLLTNLQKNFREMKQFHRLVQMLIDHFFEEGVEIVNNIFVVGVQGGRYLSEGQSEKLSIEDVVDLVYCGYEVVEGQFGGLDILVGSEVFYGQDKIFVFEIECKILVGVNLYEMLHNLILLLLRELAFPFILIILLDHFQQLFPNYFISVFYIGHFQSFPF